MTGTGYDIHRLEKGRDLILGGVKVPSETGPVAHSDGDVLAHAIIDALLGAAGLGDIGEHFPDNDPRYKGADSMELLSKTINMIIKNGINIVNIDATVILEAPKLKDHKLQMKKNIAEICGIYIDKVNIKATTNEMLGPIGRGEGIAAMAVCELSHV
ncbi:MAG: 2-C-methyl-D-erythritol 2,4-cyclodiphosphate synthase [Bacteroidota bacterium]